MLIGEYQHNLDEKGRVNFPSRLRDDLGPRFYITKGLDDCLFVYSEEEWNTLAAKLAALPISRGRPLQRFLFAGAVEAVPDKQGRVVIPQNLREHAHLDKEIMIIGASIRAEIWDKDRWIAACGELTADMVAQAMDDLGF